MIGQRSAAITSVVTGTDGDGGERAGGSRGPARLSHHRTSACRGPIAARLTVLASWLKCSVLAGQVIALAGVDRDEQRVHRPAIEDQHRPRRLPRVPHHDRSLRPGRPPPELGSTSPTIRPDHARGRSPDIARTGERGEHSGPGGPERRASSAVPAATPTPRAGKGRPPRWPVIGSDATRPPARVPRRRDRWPPPQNVTASSIR